MDRRRLARNGPPLFERAHGEHLALVVAEGPAGLESLRPAGGTGAVLAQPGM